MPDASQTAAPQTPRRCAFVAFEPMKDSAHTVYLLETYDALAGLGLDTELLVYPPGDGPQPTAEELAERYGLEHTPRIRWVPRDASRWAERVRLLWDSARACRGSDFAYTTRPLAALGALAGGARAVVLEFHIEIKPKHEVLAFKLMRGSKRLQCVCVSRQLARIVSAQTGVPESAILVEHNGISFPIRTDYAARSAAGRRVRAMYTGTFAPGRGLETVFEVARRCPEVDFVLVGGDPPSTTPLPANVEVVGRVPHAQVPELLGTADILLMPYTKGAMLPDGGGGTAEYASPLKMMEYLSAGRSIIASNLPSIAEILVNDSNALLVEPESVDDWAAAVSRLASDPELRDRLARGAVESAEQHTINRRVARILARAEERR